ncbi:MAG: hypothetical protein EOP52_03740 [Sphingobacteriales bacterium]|nr:MAG: hypothetical protein EOP52_03740 [Sphingobacteriales bacterium]
MKPDVNETLRHKMDRLDATETDPDFVPEAFWNQLEDQLHPPARPRIWSSKWYWAHAAAFLIGGVLLAFWLQSAPSNPQPVTAATSTRSVAVPVPQLTQPPVVVASPSKPQPVPETVAVKRVPRARPSNLQVAIPEATASASVSDPAVVQPQPAPQVIVTTAPAPRALYLTDAAPQTTSLVAEMPQQPLSKKRPFFLSSEPFETQTALQRPVSIWNGLRP